MKSTALIENIVNIIVCDQCRLISHQDALHIYLTIDESIDKAKKIFRNFSESELDSEKKRNVFFGVGIGIANQKMRLH